MWRGLGARQGNASRVTRHASHVTRHTSHFTRHVTRHTSHFTRHTSRHTSLRRYASLQSHQSLELSRADDLWSIFYVFIEFYQGDAWLHARVRSHTRTRTHAIAHARARACVHAHTHTLTRTHTHTHTLIHSHTHTHAHTGHLPWRKLKSKEDIGEMKKQYHNASLVAGQYPSTATPIQMHILSVTFTFTLSPQGCRPCSSASWST